MVVPAHCPKQAFSVQVAVPQTVPSVAGLQVPPPLHAPARQRDAFAGQSLWGSAPDGTLAHVPWNEVTLQAMHVPH